MGKIIFQVGEQYENEKGVYEILEIKDGNMKIRWNSGETIWTGIELQKHILRRRHWEQTVKTQAKSRTTRKSQRKTSTLSKFEGFKDSDFSRSVAGTRWRSRQQLGGAVSRRFDSGPFDMKSWAISRMARVHWTDTRHQDLAHDQFQAKLYVQMDKKKLYCGFYIERSTQTDDPRDDWDSFIEWLRTPENEEQLKTLVAEEGLILYDMKDIMEDSGAFTGSIEVSDGKWIWKKKNSEEEIPNLADFLDQLDNTVWVDLQISRILDKKTALERKEAIAGDIAALFEKLLPLYEASVSHMSR